MSRLVVNPGTPHAWEIQLRPGSNSLGRGEANDFQINDPSVSGSHCEIAVSDGVVALKDLGSTNGTFIGGSRIQEQILENGKGLKLGNVEIMYYAAAPVATAAPVVRIVAKAAVPVVAAATAVAPATATAETEPVLLIGTRFCKSHSTSPARFLCQHCDRAYCDLCAPVLERGGHATRPCRQCGTEVVRVQFRAAPTKSFHARLPGAFVYPFEGAGAIILLCATIAFAALNFVSGGIFGITIRIALYGFIFLFMQNIILTTTLDEKEPLSFPEASGLFGAAFQLAGTVAASFWLALGLAIAKFFGVDIPSAAIMGTVILGGIYFPMALLAVAMKDTIAAGNPLVVVPAMMKAPLEYSVTVILLLAVFGIRQLGELFSRGAGDVALRTHSEAVFLKAIGFKAVWAFLSVYLLTVTMRLLGLFYNGSKKKLGWFKF